MALNQTWIALLTFVLCTTPNYAFRLSPIISSVAGFTSGFFIPLHDIGWWWVCLICWLIVLHLSISLTFPNDNYHSEGICSSHSVRAAYIKVLVLLQVSLAILHQSSLLRVFSISQPSSEELQQWLSKWSIPSGLLSRFWSICCELLWSWWDSILPKHCCKYIHVPKTSNCKGIRHRQITLTVLHTVAHKNTCQLEHARLYFTSFKMTIIIVCTMYSLVVMEMSSYSYFFLDRCYF